MRTVKDPDVRRSEILDAAQRLFVTKGYGKTTIVDILQALGIAKGTFYYYFKSKEEVMDAVIARMVEQDAVRARRIAADPALSAVEKLQAVLRALQPVQGESKDRMLEQFHQPANAEMHQKSLVLGIRSLCAVLESIAQEGVEQGVFSTPYPRETMELLMVSGQVLFDRGLFEWEPHAYNRKVEAFIYNAERLLGAAPGTLSFMGETLAR